MDLSEQETHLVECLRKWNPREGIEFSMVVTGSAWDISLTEGKKWTHGSGRTFAAAWDNMSSGAPAPL